jgi:hypothetical protein
MTESNKTLYYVSSISWNESSLDQLINQHALQKNEYIEVPSNLNNDSIYKFIDQKLYETTKVIPWYYNLDIIC